MLYRQHCIANLSVGTLLSVSLGAWDLGFKFQMIFAGAFLVSTFFLSPDLDLFHSAPNRNWKFLRIVWWPTYTFTPRWTFSGWNTSTPVSNTQPSPHAARSSTRKPPVPWLLCRTRAVYPCSGTRGYRRSGA